MCQTRRVALTRREPAEETQVSSEGRERVVKRTRPGGKGKEKGTDEDELEEKEHEEDERVLVAPDMGAGGSHPQAMTDPGEEHGKRERWEDCDEDEKKRQEGQEVEKEEERAREREDEVKGEKETGKEETTDEKPPGLEDVESELKTTGEEEESGCV